MSVKYKEDLELARACKNGECAGLWEHLWSIRNKLHQAIIKRLGYSNNDLVNDCILHIVQVIESYSGESALDTWAYQVAANKATDIARKEGSRRDNCNACQDDILTDYNSRYALDGLPVDEQLVMREDAQTIEDAFDTLTDYERAVLESLKDGGHPSQETIQLIKKRPPQMREEVARIKEKFRLELEKRGVVL